MLRTHTQTAGRRLLVAACLSAILLIPAAGAAPGVLDPSFGTGGKVTTAFASGYGSANALALQPDGKLVAAGDSSNGANDYALARYNPNGSLDATFNGTGKVTTSIGPGHDVANDVVLQPDGKLVAAGYSHNGFNDDFSLARYNPNGSLDAAFNGTGKVTTAIGSSYDDAHALVLQPDGKLVAAGYSHNGVNYDFALVRYNSNGSLDATFNGTGKVTTPIGPGSDAVSDLVLQPDGKLVAAGYSISGSQGLFALARYNANGTLDSSFGIGGKVTTAMGASDEISVHALALQPDGKLVAAGAGWAGSHNDLALARYNPNGTLDASFGTGGKVRTTIGSEDYAEGIAIQPDGKVVVAGTHRNSSGLDFALLRYSADGTLDATFGSGGKVTSPIGSEDDRTSAVVLQPDGKMIVAGTAWNGANTSFALVRYLGSTLTVARAGSGSGTVTSGAGEINCGPACSAPFAAVPVTLTATASPGSTFMGWSGGCTGNGSCSVTMGSDQAATATFESDKALTLKKAGSGAGRVTSYPAGVSCSATCAHAFPHGTEVKLTARAAKGSVFAGWSGACKGTQACVVSMSAARSVVATFKAPCVVPKVKGKTLRAAKRALKRAHCLVGKVTRVSSGRVQKGRVLAAKPKQGKKLAPGTKVKLRVSKGK